jgi:hypothetical protein
MDFPKTIQSFHTSSTAVPTASYSPTVDGIAIRTASGFELSVAPAQWGKGLPWGAANRKAFTGPLGGCGNGTCQARRLLTGQLVVIPGFDQPLSSPRDTSSCQKLASPRVLSLCVPTSHEMRRADGASIQTCKVGRVIFPRYRLLGELHAAGGALIPTNTMSVPSDHSARRDEMELRDLVVSKELHPATFLSIRYLSSLRRQSPT